MKIHTTAAHCRRCNDIHPASFVRTENRIDAIVECPDGEQVYHISSDADMYLKLRQKSVTDLTDGLSEGIRPALNFISITNACNFNCAVCGFDAVSVHKNPVYIDVGEICRRAAAVKEIGGYFVQLFGGEPTLHPDIFEIVERLSGTGLKVGLATNGYLMGKDKALAAKLKDKGLKRVAIQFDSFNEEILDKFRRGYLGEKKKAVENAIEAGLDVGLNCTVTENNIHEIPDILDYGFKLGIRVKNIALASSASIGRFELPRNESVERERIIAELVKHGERFDFSFDDIFPMPSYLPLGFSVHPDCGANIVYIRSPQETVPANRYIDFQKLYSMLGNNRMKPNFFSRRLVPVYYILKCVRKNYLFRVLRLFAGLVFEKNKYSPLNIGITNYKAAAFLDVKRLSRCSSVFYTSVGPVKGCLHFYKDASWPGSREFELAKGMC